MPFEKPGYHECDAPVLLSPDGIERVDEIQSVSFTGSCGDARMVRFSFRWPIKHKEIRMLWTIFVILLVLWLLGIVSSYTLGGFIHILLVLALVVLVVNLLSGRSSAV